MMKPFLKLEKRGETPSYLYVVIPILSIILALVFSGLLIAAVGNDPIAGYTKLFSGAFGSPSKIGNTFTKAVPLMLCGLSVAVAFKMKLMNIGAEGQMTLGCLAASGVALFSGIQGPMLLVVMFIVGFLAGGLWAIVSILPKVLFGVSEVIVTLLMNYIAILFADYFIYGPWRDPDGENMPFSAAFSDDATLPAIFDGMTTSGLLVAIFAAVILFVVLRKTVWGFQVKVIGESRDSAAYAGMNIRSNILLIMLLSGGLAGLAGMCEVSGTVGRLQSGISNDSGYTAIIIAYLSRFNPLVVLLVSVLFGALQAGSFSMQMAGLPVQIVTMLQGAILLFVLAGEYFIRYKIVIPSWKKEGTNHVK